jgi:nucleotide-binding universal stress UspA family protein
MYRRILVPVDGSGTSALGLQQALGLAKDQRAQLRVLNVIDERVMATAADAYGAADMSALLQSMEETGKKALEEAAALAKAGKVRAETAQVQSRGRYVSDVILDQAKTWRADLIVMGTHGRRGLNRLLLGSDAERVLREAPVPVLLVRGEQPKRRGARKK